MRGAAPRSLGPGSKGKGAEAKQPSKPGDNASQNDLSVSGFIAAMLKKEAAALLGVSPARVSQLIAKGHLHPEPDGSISPTEVERCRRREPINWQPPYIRSGRRPAS